jgi:hypothetical protein
MPSPVTGLAAGLSSHAPEPKTKNEKQTWSLSSTVLLCHGAVKARGEEEI